MAGKYEEIVRCSFCNKPQSQVRKMIAGPNGVFICDQCVDVCTEIIEDELGYEEENVLKRVTFNDCGQRFVMVLELSDAPDKLLAVTADEVAYLLNNCLHPRNVYQSIYDMLVGREKKKIILLMSYRGWIHKKVI